MHQTVWDKVSAVPYIVLCNIENNYTLEQRERVVQYLAVTQFANQLHP